ncbi:hypothetical protein F2Q69_00008412 [Brassica cretica]|uniref:Uncharacterized protein n=1 Tax=Brassica cretica TaxID=69181 RepID=A0A8S9NQS0_BRACR|nr:hypothetical protein F2Q69_00008412 [Brassica cretica]
MRLWYASELDLELADSTVLKGVAIRPSEWKKEVCKHTLLPIYFPLWLISPDVAARAVRSFGVVVRKAAVCLKQGFSERDFRDTDWIYLDLSVVRCWVLFVRR